MLNIFQFAYHPKKKETTPKVNFLNETQKKKTKKKKKLYHQCEICRNDCLFLLILRDLGNVLLKILRFLQKQIRENAKTNFKN